MEMDEVTTEIEVVKHLRYMVREDAVPGWKTVKDEGTYKLTYDKNGNAQWAHALSEELRAHEVLVANGREVGARVHVRWQNGTNRTLTLPAELCRSRHPAEVLHHWTGLSFHHLSVEAMARWLEQVLHRTDPANVPRKEVLTRPMWRGNDLLVPGNGMELYGASETLKHYGNRSKDEGSAREGWREVVKEANERAPKLAMVLGAGVGSPYLTKLDAQTFLLHLWAGSRKGKTKASETAMAMYGKVHPDLYDTWNSTPNAVCSRLCDAGILPVLLDELGVAGARIPKQLVFSVAQGKERGRSDVTGRAREQREWNNVTLSTGEARLWTSGGFDGIRSRVLELRGPITDDRQTIDRVHKLALENYGWPLKWLADDPQPEEVKARYREVVETLQKTVSDPVLRTLCQHLAVCVVGLEQLARVVDVEVDVVASAKIVLKELKVTVGDEGDVADRLFDALMVRRANELDPLRTVFVHNQGAYFAIGEAPLKRIAREDCSLDDVSSALAMLKEQGRLIPGGVSVEGFNNYGDNGRVKRRLTRGGARVYLFHDTDSEPTEPTDDDGVGSENVATEHGF
jgi:hypothetical protein